MLLGEKEQEGEGMTAQFCAKRQWPTGRGRGVQHGAAAAESKSVRPRIFALISLVRLDSKARDRQRKFNTEENIFVQQAEGENTQQIFH